ncbi:hypothetical protein XM48_07995 [Leucobacter sp. Ag1]|nr:hypothetical protein XM48_07995 [Leucobacter sp. Ag1]
MSVGPGARAIARAGGRVLGATSATAGASGTGADASDTGAAGIGSALRLGTATGISFHPELSGDPAVHRALLELAADPDRADARLAAG